MGKDTVVAAIVAVVAAFITVQVAAPKTDVNEIAQSDAVAAAAVAAVAASGEFKTWEFTMPDAEQEAWMNADRGAAIESKILADPANSICFLTKVDFDHAMPTEVNDGGNACWIDQDEFTGWWQLNGQIKEGAAADMRCQARCLTWN